ncbi:MAG TPA: hypothetical protein V6D28_25195 [Leptolyngbyaceae cyanobacterium]
MAILTVMKKLSATAGAALIAVGMAGAARAASFNFSYTLDNGSILKGILEGDVQADGDRVFVSSVTNTSFKGIVSPDLPFVQSIVRFLGGSSETITVSFSGQHMDIMASTQLDGGDGFLFESVGKVYGIPVYVSGNSFGGKIEAYKPDRWQLTSSASNSASVNEPGSTLGLLVFGAIGTGLMLQRKQQKKRG